MTTVDQLMPRLSDRDWQVLSSIHEFHYLTTQQLARHHFGSTKAGPVPRRANHALTRLNGLGVITHLERRIGGVRAGSSGYVWVLTDLGGRALARKHSGQQTRIRTYEPSAAFLEHTLAVAEVALDIREAAATGSFSVTALELEPHAWRTHLGAGGQVVRLKPDLSVVTSNADFDDYWFIEVDRDTEPPSRVVTKCLAYERYRASGIEQRGHGVFPAVVWVVPNKARVDQLSRHLVTAPAIPQEHYAVTTPDQLATLLAQGLENFNTSTGGQKGGNPS